MIEVHNPILVSILSIPLIILWVFIIVILRERKKERNEIKKNNKVNNGTATSTQQSEESTMEKKPFTVTITDNKSGGTTTMDLTGIMMYGIEDGDEKVLKAARVLMGISPRELASISHEFENSEEVKVAKFMTAMLVKLKGDKCNCENCTKKREEEAAKKEEVK